VKTLTHFWTQTIYHDEKEQVNGNYEGA